MHAMRSRIAAASAISIAAALLLPLAGGTADAATTPAGHVSPATAYFDAIDRGSTLEPGDYIYVYPTGGGGDLVRLIMQTDGNLVLYSDSFVCFATGTYGHPGAYATYENSGSLIVFNEVGQPLWSSDTPGTKGTTLSLNENDGSLYVGDNFIAGPCY